MPFGKFQLQCTMQLQLHEMHITVENMNLEKTYIVTRKDDTQVDVSFVVERPELHCHGECETQYTYDESGLNDAQIDELESNIASNVDAWAEDVVAEFEEEQEDETEDWKEDY